MPGVTDVVVVADRRRASRAADVRPVHRRGARAGRRRGTPARSTGKSDATCSPSCKAAELPLACPGCPARQDRRGASSPSTSAATRRWSPNCAIADVRADRAEVWARAASRRSWPQEQIADGARPAADRGDRPRHRRAAARSAASCSSTPRSRPRRSRKAIGKPVKLMWHRTDDFRAGPRRTRCATSRIRATYAGGQVLTFEQRHTSVADRLHATASARSSPRWPAKLPGLATSASPQSIFTLTQEVPYNFGAIDQLLNEVDTGLQHRQHAQHLLARRRVRRSELVVDQLAAGDGQGPARVPARVPQDDRARAVLDKVARGRAAGAARCRPARRRASRSTRSTRARTRVPRRDRLPPGDRQPRRSATASPARGSPRSSIAVDVGPGDQPARPRGADAWAASCDGIALRAHLEPAPAGRPLPRGQLGQLLLHAAVEHPARRRGASSCRPTTGEPGGAGESGVAAADGRRRLRVRPGHRHDADELPDQPRRAARRSTPKPPSRPIPRVADRRPRPHATEETPDAHTHLHPQRRAGHRRRRRTTSACSGCCATCSASPARSTAAASTSARPAPATSTARRSTRARCRSADIKPTDEITTIEGLRRHRRRRTCTRCRRPGSTTTSRSAATASPARSWPRSRCARRPRAEGREITDADLDADPQHLPLRHLHPHPRGHEGRRRADVAHDSS